MITDVDYPYVLTYPPPTEHEDRFSIVYEDHGLLIYHGECLTVLESMPDESVDAIVTDPPYGLGFMGKAWDSLPPGLVWAQECLRVLKPGGHLLAFGGTRTWHRLAVAVEDAGFETRDSIAWLHSEGFPKSLDVSKAIDKAAEVTREVIGVRTDGVGNTVESMHKIKGFATSREQVFEITAPATDDAQQWAGWGTALKPAFEPIVVARKPIIGTVANNVLTYGTGALNIDGCRVATAEATRTISRNTALGLMNDDGWQPKAQTFESHAAGRWPANVILDEDQAAALDQQSGVLTSGSMRGAKRKAPGGNNVTHGTMGPIDGDGIYYADSGGASRFFYCAKAPTKERPKIDGIAHPTAKPLTLMRYLIKLVTPPNGVVLDPFLGSGTTAEAALLEGVRCIGIERESDYVPLVFTRIERSRS